ncbi:ubiquinone biosynthesis coq- mitochondrial [Fusarium agapanthi]|uniref:Ubiquinone biosynthesis coq- mitochondrial n=1 Tax=Fusarium agapanthi TaxID=1803897 RepID=A0A9P5B7H5_9HYPO|nr:ubiquinone biosynthesis coq- mitochondrial [Fusarium agapanthi]
MLLHVPNEILARICSIIECNDWDGDWDTKSSYEAILSLSRVCKRLRVIAEFHLFRSIFVLEEDPDEKWMQLARRLQQDPGRGLTTRTFCSQRYDPMAHPYFLDFMTNYFQKLSSSPDRDRIPSGLRTIIQHELKFRIFQRPYRSLKVLLMLLMPELRHLELWITDLKSTPFFFTGTFKSDQDYGCAGFEPNKEGQGTKGIPNIFFFRHLESVTLRSYDDKLGSPIGSKTVSGLFNHPSIKALTFDGFELRHSTCMKLDWSKAPSNLTRLDLENCILQPMSLQCILEKCTSLTQLNMALIGNGNVKDPTHNLGEFGDVLREDGQKLVELSIAKPMWDPHVADWCNYIGSLKKLEVLRHLSIGRLNFVGPIDDENKRYITIHDKLPQSLETLTIEAEVTGCSCDLHRVRQTEELVCDMLQYEPLPPGLKQIYMKLLPGPEARGYEVKEADNLRGWQVGGKGIWVRRIKREKEDDGEREDEEEEEEDEEDEEEHEEDEEDEDEEEEDEEEEDEEGEDEEELKENEEEDKENEQRRKCRGCRKWEEYDEYDEYEEWEQCDEDEGYEEGHEYRVIQFITGAIKAG